MKEVALRMYPYWIMGAVVLACTAFAGFKEVIRVEKKAVRGFCKFLLILTLWRIALFTIFAKAFMGSAQNVAMIPWPLTLTVFWEDACHGLPLFLFKKLTASKKWLKWLYYPIMAMVMIEFGMGHLYQGVIAAAFLSLYIPYSVKMGEKFGFGTVMACHTLFDLTTILTIKLLLGL